MAKVTMDTIGAEILPGKTREFIADVQKVVWRLPPGQRGQKIADLDIDTRAKELFQQGEIDEHVLAFYTSR